MSYSADTRAMMALSRAPFYKKKAAPRSRRRVAVPVRRLAPLELKGMDTDIDIGAVINTTNTNASSFVLNLIRSGAGSYNRVGRRVTLRSLRLTGIIQYEYTDQATTGNITGNVLRMVVVWDKQPSDALPTFDDIFGVTDQAGTETSEFLDPLKYDNMERFQVLRDKIYELEPNLFNGAGGSGDLVTERIPFDEYIKLNNKKSTFSGDSSPMTIADVSTGGLYIFYRAQTNTASHSVVAIEGANARIRYVD